MRSVGSMKSEHWVLRGLELGGAGDVLTHLLGLEVRSKLLARRGDFSGALTLAQQADELAGTTQAPLLKADAALALAEVLYLSGNIAGAGEQAARAMDHFERKGSTAGVALRCSVSSDRGMRCRTVSRRPSTHGPMPARICADDHLRWVWSREPRERGLLQRLRRPSRHPSPHLASSARR